MMADSTSLNACRHDNEASEPHCQHGADYARSQGNSIKYRGGQTYACERLLIEP